MKCSILGTFLRQEWPKCIIPVVTTEDPCPADNCTTPEPISTVPPIPFVYQPEDLTYLATSQYHWPLFNQNATGITGEWTAANGIETGPFGFGSDVQLSDTSCMRDSEYIVNEDPCAKNPLYCENGLAFSVWEKYVYETNVLTDENKSKKYLVSTGAEFDKTTGLAYPGFAIYHEGANLVALVSTGEEVWQLSVTGLIFNETWMNIGVTWTKPNLSDTSVPALELGGLEMYINKEKVGSTLLPEFTDAGQPKFTPVENFQINGEDPPVMMLGCHYDYSTGNFGGFSGGEYDELSMWTKALGRNATHDEVQFFLGGTDLNFAEVNADQFKILLGGADLSDPNQAGVAQDVLSAMLLPPPAQKSAIPTRPPNKTAATTTTMAPDGTTQAGLSNDELRILALDQLGLQDVMSTMLNTADVPAIVSPQLVEQRFPLSVVAAKLLSGKDSDNVKKWNAVHEVFPLEEAAPKTLRELNEYMMAWVGAANTSDPDASGTNWFDPKRDTMMYNSTGEDFVMNAMKLPHEVYRSNPRLILPNYDSPEWSINRESWGQPIDEFSIPTGMFKDDPNCNETDATFTFTVFNKMDRAWPRKRNMAYIRHIDWSVDCRIFSAGVAANVDPLKVTDENIKAARNCYPDAEYMKFNPLKYHCEHKLPERARLVRRPLATTWFSDVDRLGVEVRHCVYWNEEFGSTGAWDSNGCHLIETSATSTKCTCEKWGAMTVILEQAMITSTTDDCEPNEIVKYVGIGVTCVLLLIFMCGTALGRGTSDMFHGMRVHIAITWMFALLMHIVTDLSVVRLNAELNLLVGLFMEYFYTSCAMWVMMENHATFKAFTAGIIGGRTKIYYPFGYGTPLIPLGVLFLAFTDDLGLDHRCFVAWSYVGKLIYLLYNLAISFYGVVLAVIIIFNLTHPQTRRQNVVGSLRSQAKGSVVLAFAMFIFWIFATVTYLHNPESDMKDPYCIFIMFLGWIGVIFFIALGPMSNKWRWGIGIGKKETYVAAPEPEYYDDETDAMSVTTTMDTPQPTRPATAASLSSSRPATAKSVSESRPATAKSEAAAVSSRPATAKSQASLHDEENDGAGDLSDAGSE